MRSAYIIEMIPVDPTYSNWRALVWIDTETYVWLGYAIFRIKPQDRDTLNFRRLRFPCIGGTHPAPGGSFSIRSCRIKFHVPR